jgi:V/A-type H+-transporting ATPase subunit E
LGESGFRGRPARGTRAHKKEKATMEDLQNLLDRIQKDGVEQAEAQAASILAQARENAAAIVRDAEKQAADTRAAGEKDAAVFVERSNKTLEQAARDFLISVGRSLEKVFEDVGRECVGAALTPETMEQMLIRMAEMYVERGARESHIDILLNAQDRKALVAILMNKDRELLERGMDLRVDDSISRGFKVSFRDDHLYHDFTVQSIADAISQLLKAPLREIVQRVALGMDGAK